MTLSRMLRIMAWLLAIALIVWAFLDPRFRNVEGFPTGEFCLPMAASLALLFLGWTLPTRFRRFGLWTALAIVGQAVALQLIHAGPLLHYQHYKIIGQPVQKDLFLYAIFLLQTALVAVGLRQLWRNLQAWLSKNFKIWQLALIGIVFFLSSATVSPKVSDYIIELIFAGAIQTVNLANIIVAVASFPEEALISLKKRFDRFFGQDDINPNKKGRRVLDKYVIAAAIWVTVIAALLAYFSYERFPHVTDEVAYVYQARYFAEGKLMTPAPPVRESFELYLMQFAGANWYPATPPGWPAVLAIGVLFKVSWLVNPLLGGVSILLIYAFLYKMYSRRIARISLLLLCLSPWYVFMSMNYMTHTLTLTCALTAALGVLRSRETGSPIWALLAGLALGVMSLIRPLEGLVMAILIGLWAIGIGGRRLKFKAIVFIVLAAGAVGALVLPYNKALTGNPAKFPLNVHTSERFGPNSNAYGFGPDRGMGWALDPHPGHSPVDGAINADLNIFSINIELFGWSIGSLLFLGLFLSSGHYKRSDYLMMSVIAGIFMAFFFYYYSGGPDFGARYWYLMIVPLTALSVRGLLELEHKFAASQSGALAMGTRTMLGVAALCLIALTNYFPWRAIDKYHHYLGMRPDIRNLEKEYRFGRSLVLVSGELIPDFASAAVQNPVDMYGDEPIFAWDRSPEVRSRVAEAYGDHPVWLIEGPSITGIGFKVISGPLPADKILDLR
jgi:hypothetical protein